MNDYSPTLYFGREDVYNKEQAQILQTELTAGCRVEVFVTLFEEVDHVRLSVWHRCQGEICDITLEYNEVEDLRMIVHCIQMAVNGVIDEDEE